MLKTHLSKWKKWQAHSVNRQIFSAAVIVMLMTIIVKAFATGKELVVAYYFGTGQAVDAFLVAFVLPSFAINVLAGSLTVALMPVYSKVRKTGSQKEIREFYASSMAVGLLFLLAAACLMAATADFILPLIGSGFDVETMVLCRHLYYMLLPAVVINGVIMLYSTALNADKRFAIASLVPSIIPICSVLILFVFVKQVGIYALAAGIMMGMVFEAVILGFLVCRRGLPVIPRWYGLNSAIKEVIFQYAPRIGSALLMSSKVLIDTSMAAMLSPGSISALNYGNKIIAMLLGLGSAALATAVLPHFSDLMAIGAWQEIKKVLSTYTRLIFVVAMPLVAFLWYFSIPVISFLFERGKFDSGDTALVASILSFYALQLPFYTFDMFGSRLLSSMLLNKYLMYIAGINLTMNIIGNYVFMKFMGVSGIALSTSLAYMTSAILIWICLRRKISYQFSYPEGK